VKVKKVTAVSLGCLALLILALVFSTFHMSSQKARAHAIKVGDTKAQVEQRLGRATAVTPFSALWRTNAAAALFCDTAKTWAYGSHFDFQSGFPRLRVRMFLPDPDDIAVEFDSSNRVVRVTIP
jgi:hypothetical protein